MSENSTPDFIDRYARFASESCDAPMSFHKAMGYFICSSILGRFAVVITSYKPYGIKPNLWVIIIGPSRIVRKSVALELGESVIKDIDESLLLPSSFSPEALQETLANLQQGDSGVWVKDEMGGFFASLKKKDYMAGTREIFSMIYSGRGERRKLRKLDFKIPQGIYITCAGTVPTPAHIYFSEEDLISGFLNRFLLIYAETREKRIPILNMNPNLLDERASLVSDLKEAVSQLKVMSPAIISFDMETMKLLESYDMEVEQALREIEYKNPESLWKSYLAETPNQLLKMIVVRRLARGNPRQIIVAEREDFVKAFNDLQIFIKSAKMIVEEIQASASPRPAMTEEKRISRVFNAIDYAGDEGATLSELLLRTKILKSELLPILATLVEQGRVHAFITRSPAGRGRKPVRFYTEAPRAVLGSHVPLSAKQVENL